MSLRGLALFLVLGASVSVAQVEAKTDIGGFDIAKVQQAVENQRDTMGGDYVPMEREKPARQESYAIVMLRVMGYLALVVALIFGVAWVIRKAGIAGASRPGGGAMDVLEVLPFGQNRSTMLVRVMDTVYLIGQTPNAMVLLEKIEGQKAIDLIAASRGGGTIVQFKEAFNAFMGKVKKST